MDRMPKTGEIYRHFKGKEYEIVDIATHTETGESMVVYRSLSEPKDCFVRPLGMFLSKVDSEKYPDAKQEYRFERKEASAPESPKKAPEYIPNGVNPYLLEFLDARTYDKKIEVMVLRKNDLTEEILEAMAVSMEMELPAGDFEKKFLYLKKNLEMIDRMEGTHMRWQG